MDDILQLAKRTIPDTHTRVIFRGDGMTDDIFNRIKLDFPESIAQTKVFAKELFALCGGNEETLLRKLYAFVVDNVRLCIDPIGVQYVKKPSSLVHDTDRRADCKSFSIFIGSVLANLQIPFRFKFCSWKPYDRNVRHVFIEVRPGDESKRRVLDVNLKQYNKEKTPNYNNRFIDMTQIYSVGATEDDAAVMGIPSDSFLDWRGIDQISDPEMDLRIMRQGLRNEKAAVSAICGIGSTETEVYDDAIDMTNDLIGEVVDIVDSQNLQHLDERLAGIGFDYVTGAYSLSGIGVSGLFSRIRKKAKKVARGASRAARGARRTMFGSKKKRPASGGGFVREQINLLHGSIKKNGKNNPFSPSRALSFSSSSRSSFRSALDKARKAQPTAKRTRVQNRLFLRKRRKESIKNGTAPRISDISEIDPYIGGFFSKIKKAVKKAVKKVGSVTKSAVKVAAKTVVNTTKNATKAAVNATKGSLKMIKAATIAPAALVSKKARAELKKTVKSAANDAKKTAGNLKDAAMAPIKEAVEEILSEHLPKAGSFFLYCFMDDKMAEKASSSVQRKRNKAKKIRSFITKVIGVSGSKFDSICRNSIMKDYGKTPEAVLADKFGGVAGIGVAASAIVSAVLAIINLIMKYFKKKGESVSESDAPSEDDGLAAAITNGVNLASKAKDTYDNAKSTVTNTVQNAVQAGTPSVQSIQNALTNAPTNLTELQKLTGSAQSIVTNAASDVAEAMNAIPKAATDALTNRVVDNNGTQQGAAEALQIQQVKNASEAAPVAKTSGVSINPMVMGAAAVLGLGLIMMNKKK